MSIQKNVERRDDMLVGGLGCVVIEIVFFFRSLAFNVSLEGR